MEIDPNKLLAAVEGIKQLAAEGFDFEILRVMMVNRYRWTMSQATDQIEMLEDLAGVKLRR